MRLLAAILVAAVIAAGAPQEAFASDTPITAWTSRVSVRPMSELKIAATIPIGNDADWVAIKSQGVWVGSRPVGVKHVDPSTNQVTSSVALPGDPCAGLAANSESLRVPLCGAAPRLAQIDLKTQTLVHTFKVGPAGREGGIAIGATWLL